MEKYGRQFADGKDRKKENICETGLPGFGPGNAAVKVLCLTAWR